MSNTSTRGFRFPKTEPIIRHSREKEALRPLQRDRASMEKDALQPLQRDSHIPATDDTSTDKCDEKIW